MNTKTLAAAVFAILATGCASHDHANLSNEKSIHKALRYGNLMPTGSGNYIASGSGNNREIAKEYALAQAMNYCHQSGKTHAIDKEETTYQRSISEDANNAQGAISGIIGGDGLIDGGTKTAYLSRLTGHCE